MKNQTRKILLTRIKKRAQEVNRDRRHKNKFKNVAYKRLGPEIYRYSEKKKQIKINNELQKVKISQISQ